MFITHKNNVVQNIADLEWMCRMIEKGMSNSEYWAWEETIKDSDGVPDYSGETGYTIVLCRDEDVNARLTQLSDYESYTGDGITYNIKYYASKKDGSHFVPDDTTRDKRLLDEEWTRIRTERTRLLAETDHHALSDQTLSDDMKTYRKSLRDLPSDQSSKTKYSDITWPTKP